MRSPRKYTDEELIAAIKSCTTYRDVSDTLNINYYSSRVKARIINRAKFLNCDITHLSSEQSKTWRESDLIIAVKESKSVNEVVEKLGLVVRGNNYRTIKRYIRSLNLDTSHFSKRSLVGINNHLNKKPIDAYLNLGTKISSNNLKNKLYRAGLKNRICEICGQGEIWRGKKMSLILDHVNGDPHDNRLINLRIVCPNCNATLETHCGKNKKERSPEKKKTNRNELTPKRIQSYYRTRKVKRPSKEELETLLKNNSYVAVSKMFGVSDNAIRKWVKYNNNIGV